MDDQTTTLKIPALTNDMTEPEYYRLLFKKAGDAMLKNFSKETAAAYQKAQKDLERVEDQYREGYRLMIARESQDSQRL